MPSAPFLRLINVGKSYPGGERALRVLDEVSFDLASGESAAIVGPSGSGKSTLLNIIGTLDTPDTGQVLLEGDDLAVLDEESIAAIRSRRIGFIFQSHHLLPQLNVLENVLVPALARDTSRIGAAEDRARRLLSRVGLGERLGHRPGALSGGERQRVAVVRALINEPRLLLADEPTGALDRQSAEELGRLLVELNREQQVALIVVTHSAELAAQMQRRFELRDGRLASV